MEIINSNNQLIPLNLKLEVVKSEHKTFRAELISRLTKGINNLRKGTKFKETTERVVAIRANKNPFLKSDGELELLIKECERAGSYSKFFWVTK